MNCAEHISAIVRIAASDDRITRSDAVRILGDLVVALNREGPDDFDDPEIRKLWREAVRLEVYMNYCRDSEGRG